MNKYIRIATIALAVVSLAACGGKGGDKAATTTKKEAEKVKVQTLQSERIAKSLDLCPVLTVAS